MNLKIQNFILIILTLVLITSCGKRKKYTPPREVHFEKTSFRELTGWKYDNHLVSLSTFKRSCDAIMKRNDRSSISGLTNIGGNAKNWKKICVALTKSNINTNEDARNFFEKWFSVYETRDKKNNNIGKFTGYFEIELNGSIKKTKRCKYPVYAVPKNLDKIKGKSHISHSAINKGKLKGRNLEIAWVDNKAKLYFMHIQGSGVIKLRNGKTLKVGYADQNGFEYTHIGPYFKDYNAKNIDSALAMMQWLHRNPRDGRKIMEKNQSYIFFRKIEGDGPIGAQGIPLTKERSIALDSGIYPYGTPVWLESSLPNTYSYQSRDYRRLLINQDRGGAIKGGIRGDVFFGNGVRAEELACFMNNTGKMYVLFPKNITIPRKYITR